MKLICLPLMILLLLISSAFNADPIDSVTSLLGQGNVTELSKLFAPDIELTILNEEDTYSKIQATDVLNKFFVEHKPKKIKLLHKVNSNKKFLFGVSILTSTNGTYRIAYMLSETTNHMQIIELRIENEKTK
jgi:hypothetical protein